MFYYRKYYPTCIEQNFGNLKNKIKTKYVESPGNNKTCSSLKYSQIPGTDLQMNPGGSSSFACLGNTKLQNEKHQQMPYNYKCKGHLYKHVRMQKHLKCCTNKYNNYNLSACVKCFPTTSCSYHQLPLNYQKNFKKCDRKFQYLKISNDIVSIKQNKNSEEMGSDHSKLRNLSVSNQQTLYDSKCFEKEHYPCIYKISNGTPIDRLTDENNLIYNKTSNQNTYKLEKAISNISTSVQLVYHGTNSAAPICHRHFCHCDHLKKKQAIGKTYSQKCDYSVSDTLQSDVSKEIFRRSIDSSAVSSINYMDALNINIDPKLKSLPCIKHICAADVNSNTQNGEYKCRRNNCKPVKNYLHRSQPKLSVSSIMRKLKKNNLKHFCNYNIDIKTSKFSDTNKEYNIDKNNHQNCNITNTTIHKQPSKQDVRKKKLISGANIKNEIRNISFGRNNRDNNIAVHNNTHMQTIAYNQLQTNYEFVDKLQRIISENNQETGSSYNSKGSASSFKETTTTTLENSMEESTNIKQFRLKKSKKQVIKKDCTNKSLLQLVYPVKNHQIFNKKTIRNGMLVTLNTSSSFNRVYNRKKRNITKIGKEKCCKGEICAHLHRKLSSATIYSSNPSIIPRVFKKPRVFRKRRQKYKTIRSKRICWNKKYNDSFLNKLDQYCIKDIILPNFDTKGFHNLKIGPDVITVYVVKVGGPSQDGVSNDNALNPSEQVNKPGTQTEGLLNYEKISDEGSIISCSTCGTLCDGLGISSLILLACKNLAAKGDQNIQEGTTTLNKNGEEYNISPERMHKQETNEIYNQRIPLTRNVSTMVKRKSWQSSTEVGSGYYDSDIMKLSKNGNQNAIESTSSSSEYGDNLSSSRHETAEVTETSSTSLFDSVIILHGIRNSQSDGHTNSTSSYDIESKLSSTRSAEKIPHGTCICHGENIIKHVSKTHTQLQSMFTNHSTSLKKTMNCNCGTEMRESEINYDNITKKHFTNYKSHNNFNNDTHDHLAYKTQSRYTSAKTGGPLTHRLINNMSAEPSIYCICYDYPTAKHARNNNHCFKKDCNCYKNNTNGYSTERIQSERPQTKDRSVERPHFVESPSKSGAQQSTIDNGVHCASSTNSLESCKRFVDELNFINPLRNDIELNKIHTCDTEEKKQTSEGKEINKNEPTEEKETSEIKESDTYDLREEKQTFEVKIMDVHLPEEKQSFKVKEIDKYEPTEEKQTSDIMKSDTNDLREGKPTFKIKTIDVYLPVEEKQTLEVKKINVYIPIELKELDICQDLKCNCVSPSTSQTAFKQTELQKTPMELEDISTKATASNKYEPTEEKQTSEIMESDINVPTEDKKTFEVKTIDIYLPVKEKQTFEVKKIHFYKPSELNKLDTCQELKFICVTPSTSQIAFKQTKLQKNPMDLEDISTKVTASDKYDEPTEEKQTSEIKEKQTVENKIQVDKTSELHKLDACQEPKCFCVTPKLEKNTLELEEIFTKVTASGSHIYLYTNLSSKHIISTKKSVSCQCSLPDIDLKQRHIVYPQATVEEKETIKTKDEHTSDQQTEETKPLDEHSKEMLKEEHRPDCNRIQCNCDITKDESWYDQEPEETKPLDEHSKEMLKEEHRPDCNSIQCNCDITKDETWYDQETEETKPPDEHSKEMLKEEHRPDCNRIQCCCDITKDEPWYDQQTEETKPLDEHSKEMLKEEHRPDCNRIQCNCDITKDETWYDQETEETKPPDEHSKEMLKEEHRSDCNRIQCNCEDIGTVKQTKSELPIVSNVEDIPVSGYNEKEITSKSISKIEVQNNMLSPSLSSTALPTAAAVESNVDKEKSVSSGSFILNEIKQFTTVPKKEPKEKLPQKPVSTKQIDTRATASHKAIKKPTTSKPTIVAIRDKAVKYKETKSTKTVAKNKQTKVQRIDKVNLEYESVDTKVYFRITKPRSYNRNYCLNITPIRHSHKCRHLSLCDSPCTDIQQEHDLKSGQPSKKRRSTL